MSPPLEAGYQGRTRGRADDNGPVAFDITCDRDRAAEQTRAAVDEFRADGIKGRGLSLHDDRGDARPIDADHLCGERVVAQPQAITILSLCGRT